MSEGVAKMRVVAGVQRCAPLLLKMVCPVWSVLEASLPTGFHGTYFEASGLRRSQGEGEGVASADTPCLVTRIMPRSRLYCSRGRGDRVPSRNFGGLESPRVI